MNVRSIDPAQLKNAPLKAAILVGVDDAFINPEGFLSIIRKDAAAAGKGTLLANLAGAPQKNESDTIVNPFEDIYSKTGDIEGDVQWQSTRVEIAFTPVSRTLDVLKLIYPGSKFEDILGADAVKASTTRGTANAGRRITAKTGGVAGNSISYGETATGASAVLAVSVSGTTITVALATDTTGVVTSTANQVIAAINGHAGAAALVTASLPADSTGAAVVAASAAAALTGGVNGTKVGTKRTSRGRITLTDYHKNVVLCWTTVDKTVAGCYVIRKAINIEEDKNYEFNDDGQAFGVDVTMRGHADGTTLDAETGQVLPNFEEHDYGVILPAA